MSVSTPDTSRLRLLFLSDAVAEDMAGGSYVAARELARGLTARGHQVTFLVARHSPEPPDDQTQDGIRILRYAGAGNAPQFLRHGHDTCARLMAQQGFDLVHTHFAYAAVGPLLAVPKAVPRIRTFHGPWDEECWIEDTQKAQDTQRTQDTQQAGAIQILRARVKRRIRSQIERRSLESSAKVLTLSQCFRDMALNHYGVAPRQMEMIPGGTDTASFQPLPSTLYDKAGKLCDKAAVRRRLGLAQERQILLSVRRLTPRMGLDRLIQAMPEIIARCPAACLVIGGKGPEEGRLRHLIEALGLQNHVQLVGFIAPEQLVSYYQAADLFVLPTLALEGFGLVTTEALSCGLPVIGTPIGATPEILAPLDRRLIALSTEPHCLADAVVGYLEGSWGAGLTPAHLHEYVRRHYTWERHVSRIEQVYLEVLASARSRAETRGGADAKEPQLSLR